MTMEETDSDEDYDPNNDKLKDGRKRMSYGELRYSDYATVAY